MVRWSFFVTFADMKIALTRDNLDYIAFVAKKYCNLFEAGWEEYVVENALDLFCRRIDKIDCSANYPLYKSTEMLQESIKKKGYDSDKFWLLLLFMQDYTDSCFGEYYVFDNESIGDNIKKMIAMLTENDSSICELTLRNKTDSAHISTIFIKNELQELLQSIPQKTMVNLYPSIDIKCNNVLWHKIKFFMDMLDYFLLNYTPISQKRKEWILLAQSLYLVGFLDDEKYLYGNERVVQKRTDIDGNVTTKEIITPLKGLGKYFTDNTKNCKVSPNCRHSYYCYNPYANQLD